MEEALEKLKVLGGDKFLKPQYTRVYFAIDISGGRKLYSAGNRYNQFREFIVLSSNLLEELGHRVPEEVLDEMQNPLHTVREILDSMINVGFPPDAAGACPLQR